MGGYLHFDDTGVPEIDEILNMLTRAGNGYHHTEDWGEPIENADGKSYKELIQEAANKAADKFRESK